MNVHKKLNIFEHQIYIIIHNLEDTSFMINSTRCSIRIFSLHFVCLSQSPPLQWCCYHPAVSITCWSRFFHGEKRRVDVRVRGGNMQSVLITAPSHPVPLDACNLAAQPNSGIGGHTHSTQATTNHLDGCRRRCPLRLLSYQSNQILRPRRFSSPYSFLHMQTVRASFLL